MKKIILIILMTSSLSGCGIWGRLKNIGQKPALSPIENPTTKPDYMPVSQPMPEMPKQSASANSLWQKGSSGFFKDLRASQVGDILTVKISAQDAALMENETEQNREDNSDSMSINAFAGFEKNIETAFPEGADASDMLDITSNREISGDGKIDRKESIDMTLAATVIQVLPNGNLVIQGTQEIRVNYEVRQLSVVGIARRADISSDNTIQSSKIADLRVSYGGEGVISEVQQPRYGRQFLDIVAPF